MNLKKIYNFIILKIVVDKVEDEYINMMRRYLCDYLRFGQNCGIKLFYFLFVVFVVVVVNDLVVF